MNTSVSAFTKTKRKLTDIVPELVFVLLLSFPVSYVRRDSVLQLSHF